MLLLCLQKKVRKQINEKCKNFHGGGGTGNSTTNPLPKRKGGRCREVKAAPLQMMRKEVNAQF